MTLRGRLADFALADLVQLLGTTRRSGALHMQGSPCGVVFFDEGMLLAAWCLVDGEPTAVGSMSDTLIALSRSSGLFEFQPGERPAAAEIVESPMAVDDVVARLHVERRRPVVTEPLAGRLTLTSTLPTGIPDVRLTAADWARLVASANGIDLKTLAEREGEPADEIAAWARKMVVLGVAHRSEPPADRRTEPAPTYRAAPDGGGPRTDVAERPPAHAFPARAPVVALPVAPAAPPPPPAPPMTPVAPLPVAARLAPANPPPTFAPGAAVPSPELVVAAAVASPQSASPFFGGRADARPAVPAPDEREVRALVMREFADLSTEDGTPPPAEVRPAPQAALPVPATRPGPLANSSLQPEPRGRHFRPVLKASIMSRLLSAVRGL